MGTIRKLKSWRAVGELSFPKQDTHLQVMQLIAAALSVQHPHTRRGKAVVRAPPPLAACYWHKYAAGPHAPASCCDSS